MIRIGIPAQGFASWGGGIDFLRMLISSLHHTGESLEFHLLCPTRGPRPDTRYLLRRPYRGLRSLMGMAGTERGRVEAERARELAQSVEPMVAVHEIHEGSIALGNMARKLSLDVLIPSFQVLPSDFPVPWIGYAYDFQHRYFPQLFEPRECERRDRHFADLGHKSRALIVNARAVAADLERFHPGGQARVFVLPFCPAPQVAWVDADASTAARLGIARPYFIVCNQFWKHKDHLTAFEAFASFAAEHPDVDLVCTGDTEDLRAPEYFPELLQRLDARGIRSRVHILGRIAKQDQIALMSGALALVQPTLFEGGPGGGAVYDAVAIGQRCVVSDIPVNREIEAPDLRFFTAGDATSLAACLRQVLGEPAAPRPNGAILLERGRAQRAACGRVLLQAIDHVRQPRSA